MLWVTTENIYERYEIRGIVACSAIVRDVNVAYCDCAIIYDNVYICKCDFITFVSNYTLPHI